MALASLKDALLDRMPERVLACTYGFDPVYFDQEILPAILPEISDARDGGNIASYLNAGDEAIRQTPVVICCSHTEPGKELGYNVVRVTEGPAAYHPKLLLLDYGDVIRAIVASANLTRSGWSTALETFVFEDLPPRGRHRWAKPLLRFVKGTRRLVPGAAEQAVLEPFETRLTSIKEEARPWAGAPALVSSFDGPLFDTVVETQPNATHVAVVSPFFEDDEGAGVFDRLLAQYPRAKGTLYVRTEEAEGGPVIRGPESKIKALLDSGRWELRCVDSIWDGDTDEAPPRQLHGKLLFLSRGRKSTVLVGSANFTRSALLRASSAGNVELGVVLELKGKAVTDLIPQSSPAPEGITFEAAIDEDEEDVAASAADYVESATYDCRTGKLSLVVAAGAPELTVLYEGKELGPSVGAGTWSASLRIGRSMEVTVRDREGHEGPVPFVIENIALMTPRGLTRDLRLDELLDVLAGYREPVDEGDGNGGGGGGPGGAGERLGRSSAFAWRKLMRALAGVRRDLEGALLRPVEVERLLDGPVGCSELLKLLETQESTGEFFGSEMAFVVHQLRLVIERVRATAAAVKGCPSATKEHLDRWSRGLAERFDVERTSATGALRTQLDVLVSELPVADA